MRGSAKLRDLRGATQLPVRRNQAASQLAAGPSAGGRLIPARPHAPFRLLRLLDSLPMRALRRLIARALGRALEFAVYIAIAALIGLSSAWYMVEVGTRLTVERTGPWQRWTLAGSTDADPYTRAHFNRAGWLPLDTTAAVYFAASRDSAGEPLYSDCDYSVAGPLPVARRWTLVAYDMSGMLIEAGAGPPVVASEAMLPGPGGTVTITVSPLTSAGNWLSTAGSTRMQLLLTLFGVQQTAAVKSAAAPARDLFKIDRTGCR